MLSNFSLRILALGLALLGCSAMTASGARAADFDPGYAPYPDASPDYDRTIERERRYTPAPERQYEAVDGRCRVFLERRVDPYGREIVHRIRACDEGPAYPYPNRAFDPGPRDYQPAPYYERSRYRAYPRPPADIGDD